MDGRASEGRASIGREELTELVYGQPAAVVNQSTRPERRALISGASRE
jgi:hypothetical protein